MKNQSAAAHRRKNDYELMKKFVINFLEWYYPKDLPPPEESPAEYIAKLEKKSLSKTKAGLRTSLNGIVELTCAEWTPAQMHEADKRFLEAGLPTLSQLRLRYSRQYSKIMKAGVIDDEVEYYIVKEVRDGWSSQLPPSEVAKLDIMIDFYENRVNPSNSA